MSSLFLVVFFLVSSLLLIFFTLSCSALGENRTDAAAVAASSLLPSIQQACKATRNPQTCEFTLTQSHKLPPNPTMLQIIQASIWATSQDLHKARSMIQTILRTEPPNVNLTNAAQNCVEYFKYAEFRIRQTVDALKRGQTKDARAWLTAAQVYEYDTWSALKYVNTSQLINQTMSFTDSLINMTGNALSMTKEYDLFGADTGSWLPPRTERDGFWETDVGPGNGPDVMSDFRLDYKSDYGSEMTGFADLKPDVMVCKGGACDYETVQDAVDAGPSNGRRYVIGIKNGTYEETVRVPLKTNNVVFLGDGMGKTIITGSNNVQPGVSTFNTATVGVLGDGFMASGLTIQNTAGPDVHQAVAFMSDSDQSIIENVEFIGNQDTLYAHSLRQFYKGCRIVGNVDFIFGNSASFFQDCLILIKPRQVTPEKGETNAITAHGRIDPSQSSGFVFNNCLINGTEEFVQLCKSNPVVHKNFLGRPWKEFAKTVYINCFLEGLIKPEGWSPWAGDQGLATLFYGEFNSTGAGANATARVPWSNQIPPEHVSAYSVENFIQGHEWIQS